MPNFPKWSPALYVISALAIAAPTATAGTAPSEEFWNYLEECGDDKGEVLDPLDYEQMLNLKTGEEIAASSTTTEATKQVNEPQLNRIDTNTGKKSSARSSTGTKEATTL